MSEPHIGRGTPGLADALLRLAATHDASAWSDLIEHAGEDIFLACRRILNDNVLADDVVQETLLQVRDHAGCFKPPDVHADEAARRWMMRIACNTALQMLRHNQRATRREDDYARRRERDGNGESESLLETLEKNEQTESIRREILALPQRYRHPMVLHYFGGLTMEGLAAELRCPVGTVKTNIRRGLDKIRQRMAILGFIFPVDGLEQLLKDPPVPSQVLHNSNESIVAKGMGVSPTPITNNGLNNAIAQWQALLSSSRKPVFNFTMTQTKGLTLMSKLAISAATMAVVGALAFTMGKMNGGEDLPTEAIANTAPAVDQEEVVQGNNEFALDLYARLRTQEGNIFFSPSGTVLHRESSIRVSHSGYAVRKCSIPGTCRRPPLIAVGRRGS